MLRRGLRALLIIVSSVLVGGIVTESWRRSWHWTRGQLGTDKAIVAAALTAIALAAIAALLYGPARVVATMARIRAMYLLRVAPYLLRDTMTLYRVGGGRRNQQWESEEEFISEDLRRADGDQLDFGVHWREGKRARSIRLTYIADTKEMIAVSGRRGADDSVKLLAVLSSEAEAASRMDRYAYARLGGASMTWVRRRLAGWNVPLPPRGQLLYELDQRPPVQLPRPPEPTMWRHTIGAYSGASTDGDNSVNIVVGGESRRLHHYVSYSPTGFSWGYVGAGPTDLAQSILADRLGYPPATPVSSLFRNEVIAGFPQDEDFILSFEQVDSWIDSHRKLFAKYPRSAEYHFTDF